MKKDKEWLKGRIKGFQEGENMFTAEFNAGVQDALEYVQELINQLDEPETLSQEWIDENKVARINNVRKMTTSDVVAVEKLQNLLVPKQDKPVIPQFVADWIDTHNLYGNNPLKEYRDLEIDFNEGWTNEEDAAVYHWANKNPYAFIDALRYGYDAEKEKLYTVDLPHSYQLIKLLHTQTYRIKKYSESGFGDYTTTFTETEIKDYDERFWTFAEEVTPCN